MPNLTRPRSVLITGAARGLGRAMALELLRNGYNVVLASTDKANLADVIAAAAKMPGIARPLAANLADPGAAEQLAVEATDVFGGIDVLINNAGVGLNELRLDYMASPVRLWEMERAVVERFFAINAIAPMILASRLVPPMIARGWGRVISNTTSLDSMLRFSLYGGSKAALEAETAVLAEDLASTGVTSNVLIPGGGTATRMTDEVGIPRDQLFPDTIMEAPISFLASDASDSFTGRRILAYRWRTDLPADEAAQLASDPIAWTGVGSPGLHPQMAMKKSRD